MHKWIIGAAAAGLSVSAAASANAMPTNEDAIKASKPIVGVVTAVGALRDALGANPGRTTAEAACLEGDYGVLHAFELTAEYVQELATLYPLLKDTTDQTLLSGIYDTDYRGLKQAAHDIEAYADTRPAACKATPFAAANPTLFSDARTNALAALALLGL